MAAAPKKKPVLPKTEGKAPKGPKLGKPGNSNTPKQASAPKQLEYKPDLKSKQYRTLGNVNRATPPETINLHDRNPFTNKLKPSSPASTAKPDGTGRFTKNIEKGAQVRKVGGYAANAAKAESTLAKGARIGLKTAGKALGRANIVVDMIANAQPAGEGSDKPSGRLMKGNQAGKGMMRQPAATPLAAYEPKPKASGSMGMSFNGGTATGRQPMGMSFNGGAAPASSTSDSKFKKGSYTELAYKPTGNTEKRGNVVSTTAAAPSAPKTIRTGGLQSKYQRDDLAMNQRKR